MKNYQLCIEYDGTNFYGWEIQPQKRTIRGEIESALSRLLGEKINLTSGARTDRGVHALNQIANLKTDNPLPVAKIRKGLQGLLSQDIFVKDVLPVNSDFDSRRDAESRVYLYKLLIGRCPLKRKYVWEYRYKLNITRMNKVLSLFIGTYDFKYFSFKDAGICCVKKFEIYKDDNELTFEVESNRFLHKMVRMLVGTVTEIGRGKEINIKEMLIQPVNHHIKKNLCAPPQGLYLKEIKY